MSSGATITSADGTSVIVERQDASCSASVTRPQASAESCAPSAGVSSETASALVVYEQSQSVIVETSHPAVTVGTCGVITIIEEGGGSALVEALETDVLTFAGMAVYSTIHGHADAAQANSTATKRCVGLATETKSPGFAVDVVTHGTVELADWSAATGAVSLSPGSAYYLSPTLPGNLTTVAPVAVGEYVVKVGRALSASRLDVDVNSPILL